MSIKSKLIQEILQMDATPAEKSEMISNVKAVLDSGEVRVDSINRDTLVAMAEMLFAGELVSHEEYTEGMREAMFHNFAMNYRDQAKAGCTGIYIGLVQAAAFASSIAKRPVDQIWTDEFRDEVKLALSDETLEKIKDILCDECLSDEKIEPTEAIIRELVDNEIIAGGMAGFLGSIIALREVVDHCAGVADEIISDGQRALEAKRIQASN
jgi:hypothetical protein